MVKNLNDGNEKNMKSVNKGIILNRKYVLETCQLAKWCFIIVINRNTF